MLQGHKHIQRQQQQTSKNLKFFILIIESFSVVVLVLLLPFPGMEDVFGRIIFWRRQFINCSAVAHHHLQRRVDEDDGEAFAAVVDDVGLDERRTNGDSGFRRIPG